MSKRISKKCVGKISLFSLGKLLKMAATASKDVLIRADTRSSH